MENTTTTTQAAALTMEILHQHPSATRAGDKEETHTFLITLQAATAHSPTPAHARQPLDLVLVVDRSHSMSIKCDNSQTQPLDQLSDTARIRRIDMAEQVALALSRYLDPKQDRLALVTFGVGTRRCCSLTNPRAGGLQEALRQLSAEPLEGDTNLGAGLTAAFEALEENPKEDAVGVTEQGRVRAVLVLTDGRPNVGSCTLEQLQYRLDSHDLFPRPADVVVHTIGLGQDHDADLLRALATHAGHGSYFYVSDLDTMRRAFAVVVGDLVSRVASKIQLVIEPALPTLVSHLATRGNHDMQWLEPQQPEQQRCFWPTLSVGQECVCLVTCCQRLPLDHKPTGGPCLKGRFSYTSASGALVAQSIPFESVPTLPTSEVDARIRAFEQECQVQELLERLPSAQTLEPLEELIKTMEREDFPSHLKQRVQAAKSQYSGSAVEATRRFAHYSAPAVSEMSQVQAQIYESLSQLPPDLEEEPVALLDLYAMEGVESTRYVPAATSSPGKRPLPEGGEIDAEAEERPQKRARFFMELMAAQEEELVVDKPHSPIHSPPPPESQDF